MTPFAKRLHHILALLIVALSLVPESSCASYAVQSKGSKLKEKSLLDSHDAPIRPKRKKLLKISKNLYKKLIKDQDQMEEEAQREADVKEKGDVSIRVYQPVLEDDPVEKTIVAKDTQMGTRGNFLEELPPYKHELRDKTFLTAPHDSVNASKEEDKERLFPFYWCPNPLEDNATPNGGALIRPDPFDCGCYYYCNWGVHYQECCSWPLLWNDNTKCCDWYWRVICKTFSGYGWSPKSE